MTTIDRHILGQLPLTEIAEVTFYKRDAVTSDLMCCDVVAAGSAWTFNEEQTGWDLLLKHLSRLPNFHTDWYAAVPQPPFATSETIAFKHE